MSENKVLLVCFAIVCVALIMTKNFDNPFDNWIDKKIEKVQSGEKSNQSATKTYTGLSQAVSSDKTPAVRHTPSKRSTSLENKISGYPIQLHHVNHTLAIHVSKENGWETDWVPTKNDYYLLSNYPLEEDGTIINFERNHPDDDLVYIHYRCTVDKSIPPNGWDTQGQACEGIKEFRKKRALRDKNIIYALSYMSKEQALCEGERERLIKKGIIKKEG